MNSSEIATNLALALHPPAGGNVRFELRVVAETREMIWNAVVVFDGHVYVAGPRWSGESDPPVARIGPAGKPVAFPNESWNRWRPGASPAEAFVNVNALHYGGDGQLFVIDSGTPMFGGDPVPGGAKVVQIDLKSAEVKKIFPLGADIARAGSYIDDLRINGEHGYLTDAGQPGIIVLNMRTGLARRVLDGHPSAVAPPDRPIVVAGRTVLAPDGSNLRVHSDPLELSSDGMWLLFGPLEGPWAKIETRYLDDDSLTQSEIANHVESWADIPPIGGAAMDRAGNLYFTDLAGSALKKRAPDGTMSTIVSDSNLHWVDAPFIDENNAIWMPVPQMDRVALFHNGKSEVQWPVRLYYMQL